MLATRGFVVSEVYSFFGQKYNVRIISALKRERKREMGSENCSSSLPLSLLDPEVSWIKIKLKKIFEITIIGKIEGERHQRLRLLSLTPVVTARSSDEVGSRKLVGVVHVSIVGIGQIMLDPTESDSTQHFFFFN